jgi:glycosyltransferase involved in cell wall biosynthesis
MKVLFDHPNPFLLAHGGFQIQIERTKESLQEIGIEVDWLRWWDSTQFGDVIHFFGRPGGAYIDFAHKKGIKVVMSELLTGLGSRSFCQRAFQKGLIGLSQRVLPSAFTAKLGWEAYRKADAIISLTTWEKHLMMEMFDASLNKVHVVPNGVEEVFIETSIPHFPSSKADHLVCTATITERKRVLEMAEAAILAKTPVWIIGTPYSEQDPYYLRFLEVVNKSGGLIHYEGGISDRLRLAKIYRSSKGFVLLSTMESLSLSALEAAASGCPLLLSDLPWATSTFGKDAYYCAITSVGKTAETIKYFHDTCSSFRSLYVPYSWSKIAFLLKSIYEGII